MKTFGTLVCLLLLFEASAPLARAQDARDRLDMQAHAALETHNYDLAIQCWSEILKKDPKDATATFNRGIAYVDKGDTDDAMADFNRALQLDPRNLDTYMTLGGIFRGIGEYNKAIAAYTEVIRLDPTNADAYEHRAHIYSWRGMDDYEGTVHDEDSAKEFADYEAALQLRMTGVADRKAWLEKEASTNKSNIPLVAFWDLIVKLDPKDDEAYSKRADAYATECDYAKAVADYSEAIRRDPQNPGLYIKRGDNLMRDDNAGKAIADYTEAIRLKPASADACASAYTGRALSYKSEEQYDKAIADFDEAIRATPKDFNVWFNRGCAYEYTGEYDKAIADFDEAIRINPDTAWLRYERADAYIAKGDKKKAEEEYASMEENFSGEIKDDPKESGGHTDRADLYAHLGEYDKAIADCNEAIRIEPNLVESVKQRGSIYLKMGDAKDAIRDFDQLVHTYPDPDEACFLRGSAYAAAGDYAKAVADFQKTLAMTPGRQDALDTLARLYAACPKAEFRDTPKALEMAMEACKYSKWKESDYIDTLAAAEAADGKFDAAAKWQQWAIEIADAVKGDDRKDDKAMQAMAARLALYQQKKPYREEEVKQ